MINSAKKWHGYLLAFIAACGWATGGLISKWVFSYAPVITPEILAAARSCVSAAILGVILLIFRRTVFRMRWSWQTVLYLFSFGAILVVAVQFTYYKTISLTSVATAILLQYLAPIFTLALGVAFFKQKLRWQMVVGVVCAIIGCAFAVGAFASGGLTITPTGLALGVLSAFLFAIYSMMGAHAGPYASPLALLFYGLIFASIMWTVVNALN
ncbi:MAG: DMT family transporter [Coriobacteriia bacterium]|nr:DMT family transporter [Coriobacteriia bacterium]